MFAKVWYPGPRAFVVTGLVRWFRVWVVLLAHGTGISARNDARRSKGALKERQTTTLTNDS